MPLHMLIGYARVSRALGQDPAAQVQAPPAAGAERTFVEHASGGRWARPELKRLLDTLRAGDVLEVWTLDRLSRSLKDLLPCWTACGRWRWAFAR